MGDTGMEIVLDVLVAGVGAGGVAGGIGAATRVRPHRHAAAGGPAPFPVPTGPVRPSGGQGKASGGASGEAALAAPHSPGDPVGEASARSSSPPASGVAATGPSARGASLAAA